MRDDFHDQLIAALPRLRLQALALTRQRAAAEDLLQDAVANALSARHSFAPATDFAAWTRRILHNRFVSIAHGRRGTAGIEEVPRAALAVGTAAHEDRLVLRELAGALGRLPAGHREALFMTALRGMTYEDVAEANGCSVGTVKSRVERTRAQLRAWLVGGEAAAKPSTRNALHDTATCASKG